MRSAWSGRGRSARGAAGPGRRGRWCGGVVEGSSPRPCVRHPARAVRRRRRTPRSPRPPPGGRARRRDQPGAAAPSSSTSERHPGAGGRSTSARPRSAISSSAVRRVSGRRVRSRSGTSALTGFPSGRPPARSSAATPARPGPPSPAAGRPAPRLQRSKVVGRQPHRVAVAGVPVATATRSAARAISQVPSATARSSTCSSSAVARRSRTPSPPPRSAAAASYASARQPARRAAQLERRTRSGAVHQRRVAAGGGKRRLEDVAGPVVCPPRRQIAPRGERRRAGGRARRAGRRASRRSTGPPLAAGGVTLEMLVHRAVLALTVEVLEDRPGQVSRHLGASFGDLVAGRTACERPRRRRVPVPARGQAEVAGRLRHPRRPVRRASGRRQWLAEAVDLGADHVGSSTLCARSASSVPHSRPGPQPAEGGVARAAAPAFTSTSAASATRPPYRRARGGVQHGQLEQRERVGRAAPRRGCRRARPLAGVLGVGVARSGRAREQRRQLVVGPAAELVGERRCAGWRGWASSPRY